MLKNLINYSFFSILNSGLVLINGFLLAKYTSIELFGLLSFYQVLIIGLSQLLNFNTLGLVPITLSGKIQVHFDDYRKIIHSLMLLAFTIIIIISFIFSYFVYYDFIFILLFMFLLFLISSNDIDNSRLIGLGLSFNYGVALFITRIIQFLFILYLGVMDLLTIKSWLTLIIFSEFISLLYRRNFTLFKVFDNLKIFFIISAKSNFYYIIFYGLKYIPILIFGYLYQYADRYLMKFLMSPSDLGLFSYALLLSSSVSVFASSLLNVFVPDIYKNNINSSKKILKSSFLINVVAGLSIIFILVICLPLISYVLDKPEIESLSLIFLITSLGVVFQGMYKIVGALLDANILYWQKLCSFFVASAVNIFALFLFFYFSSANILTFSIAYLLGNLSLFIVSLLFLLNYFKSKL